MGITRDILKKAIDEMVKDELENTGWKNTGWICLICGAVLNPTVTECPNCKHREGTIKYVPFIPTPNYYRYPEFGPYPGYDLIWTC